MLSIFIKKKKNNKKFLQTTKHIHTYIPKFYVNSFNELLISKKKKIQDDTMKENKMHSYRRSKLQIFFRKVSNVGRTWIMFENDTHSFNIYSFKSWPRDIELRRIREFGKYGDGEKFAKVSGKTWTNRVTWQSANKCHTLVKPIDCLERVFFVGWIRAVKSYMLL